MKRKLACSFCGKDEHQVQRLVAGPNVFICDACVAMCNQILARHPPGHAAAPDASAAPEPHGLGGPRTRKRRSLFDWLKGMTRMAPGVDLTGPADPAWGGRTR